MRLVSEDVTHELVVIFSSMAAYDLVQELQYVSSR